MTSRTMSHHLFPWTDAFLAALRHRPVLTHACQVVGIDRSTAFRRRQTDKAFADAVQDAMAEGVDRAEMAAFERGVDGYHEPVIYKGQLCFTPLLDRDGQVVMRDEAPVMVPLTVRKHSDQMLALVLQGRRKEVYATRTEITGAEGGPLQTNDTARAARAAALLELARQRKAEAADDFSDIA